jgi:signal transduction histidine kinase
VLTINLKEKNTTVEILQKLPVIMCDRIRVRELFQNLIGNALKYNDNKENKIEISYVKDHPRAPGEIVFYVRDHGIGIAEKHLEAIFKIFKRLHTSEAYGGGTGSGLAIVRKIVTQHGGKIWAESKGEGQGTTFFFTLPQK